MSHRLLASPRSGSRSSPTPGRRNAARARNSAARWNRFRRRPKARAPETGGPVHRSHFSLLSAGLLDPVTVPAGPSGCRDRRPDRRGSTVPAAWRVVGQPFVGSTGSASPTGPSTRRGSAARAAATCSTESSLFCTAMASSIRAPGSLLGVQPVRHPVAAGRPWRRRCPFAGPDRRPRVWRSSRCPVAPPGRQSEHDLRPPRRWLVAIALSSTRCSRVGEIPVRPQHLQQRKQMLLALLGLGDQATARNPGYETSAPVPEPSVSVIFSLGTCLNSTGEDGAQPARRAPQETAVARGGHLDRQSVPRCWCAGGEPDIGRSRCGTPSALSVLRRGLVVGRVAMLAQRVPSMVNPAVDNANIATQLWTTRFHSGVCRTRRHQPEDRPRSNDQPVSPAPPSRLAMILRKTVPIPLPFYAATPPAANGLVVHDHVLDRVRRCELSTRPPRGSGANQDYADSQAGPTVFQRSVRSHD